MLSENSRIVPFGRDYCIYLRKSRSDLEAEAHGQGDTLLRHRTKLLSLAKAMHLNIGRIYEEGVKSGETITSRPVMQELLHDVEAGQWAGVLVMEVERLARGDTIDQGLVSRAFQFSGTRIITPVKTYDPQSEFDQEYFEFGLFMSRREYKTINRRQQLGRLASVNEGKWPSNRAPYGYERIKLEGQKGWTLRPNENAQVVADIFRWYTEGQPTPSGFLRRLGASRIVTLLNKAGIPSPGGRDWTPNSVKDILRNPAYAGWVRWGNRPQVKVLRDGAVVKTRPRTKEDSETMKLCRGLHEPIISQETFDKAAALLKSNPSRPGPKQLGIKSPLAGLVTCGCCGRKMVRRPYRNGHKDGLICPYPSCPTMGSDLDTVEAAILQALRSWLADFEQTPPDDTTAAEAAEQASLERSISALQREMEQISQQEQRAYDLVEQGVYSIDLFTSRCQELSRRRLDLEQRIQSVTSAMTTLEQQIQAKSLIAPAVRHVLDSYTLAETPEEKNTLLHSVLKDVIYTKTTGGRYKASNMTITIHPRLPF